MIRRRPRPRKVVEKTDFVGCFNQFRIIMLVSPTNAFYWLVLCRGKLSISDLVPHPLPLLYYVCFRAAVQEKGIDVAER